MNELDIKEIKGRIKSWILEINDNDELPQGIIALNFGLFEPYGIELIGSESYDEEDDDWACEEDFEPKTRSCSLPIPSKVEWEEVLGTIVLILKELVQELKDIQLLNVKHITTGFSDGDLMIIK